ncbi:hypothetical protein [Ideonella sp. A 288]|uniref:hypothetical protein n=1 Tax=Ideonella sp. A 288 TaxID=1962181 RepID=UPI00130362CC|nr:hypothetical protein [Ideonella sp. A 288]
MHTMSCRCAHCRTGGGASEFESLAFPASVYRDSRALEAEFEAPTGDASPGGLPFSEAEEHELAMELLSVASEDELDQFLGKLFKGAWKGLRKVGSAVGRIAKPLGGALKGLAKQALPFVGGALGSLIPIPGVGTAIGTALGSTVANALEAEFGALEAEDMEFESARRFVRIAGSAARRAAAAAPGADPLAAVRAALQAATRQHLPGMAPAWQQEAPTDRRGAAQGGRWTRRGGQIVVEGA